jgi:hypothetical protein
MGPGIEANRGLGPRDALIPGTAAIQRFGSLWTARSLFITAFRCNASVENRPSNSPEMDRFNAALKQAMSVSKAELKRLLAQDKITPLAPQKRGRKPKPTNP